MESRYWFRYFPPNKRAALNDKDEQIQKIREELSELKDAMRKKEGDERIAEEAIDLIHAVEGLIDKLDVNPEEIIMLVYEKNRKRGDYRG